MTTTVSTSRFNGTELIEKLKGYLKAALLPAVGIVIFLFIWAAGSQALLLSQSSFKPCMQNTKQSASKLTHFMNVKKNVMLIALQKTQITSLKHVITLVKKRISIKSLRV